jgi:hypothetical protein
MTISAQDYKVFHKIDFFNAPKRTAPKLTIFDHQFTFCAILPVETQFRISNLEFRFN